MPQVVSVFLSWLLVAAPASREEVLAEAQTRWAAGDMEGVVTLFDEAAAEEPLPEYLFGRARAEIKLGRCEDAIKHLNDFLNTEPRDDKREAAEAELEKCGVTEPASATPPDPVTQPVPSPPPASATRPTEAPTTTDSAPRRGVTDGLGWSLVGAGGALAVVGVALYGVGASRIASPGATPDEQAYRERTGAAQQLGWSGVGVAAAGLVVLTGGVVRLLIARRRTPSR